MVASIRLPLAGVLAVLLAVVLAPPTPVGSSPQRDPNILVIVTDDQRARSMQTLPKTRQWFGKGGTSFRNAVATTPVCCPSRASIFTGRFAHNHDVRRIPDGELLDQESTVQRYLQDSGYRTAMVGKYLNQWPLNEPPPYFDRFSTTQIGGMSYYDRKYNIDGTMREIPGYSTTILADRAQAYIEEFESRDDDPWFLYVAPVAPHSPYTVEAEHRGADVPKWDGNPAVFERNTRDKPPWFSPVENAFEKGKRLRKKQLRTLLSVDEMVELLRDTLAEEGEASDTIAFFLSDNGLLLGEHGMFWKGKPYRQAVGIPLYLRWPGNVADGARSGELAANIDVAPTIMRAARITPDGRFPVDGESLLSSVQRKKILTEVWKQESARSTAWAASQTSRYNYVEHYARDGTVLFRELYLLRDDPWELQNILHDDTRRNDSDVPGLSAELRAMRRCGGAQGPSCREVLKAPVALCPGKERILADHEVGTRRADLLRGSDRGAVLCGLGGDDVLIGGASGDVVRGGSGDDTVRVGGGADRVSGGSGGDGISGDQVADHLYGFGGNDALDGGPGPDVCHGGRGNDRFRRCEVTDRG